MTYVLVKVRLGSPMSYNSGGGVNPTKTNPNSAYVA
jgi:hypothetical protein